MTAADRRRRAHDDGLAAERLAALWLRLKGYRVLARRWRCHLGEIDLVAYRPSFRLKATKDSASGTLVAVEVKRRADEAAALDAVTLRQRERIARAAEVFLRAHPRLNGCAVRFDVVAVIPGRWPLHVADAWRP